MKTVEDYHNLHLKCDVLLLADVFENFRHSSLKNHGLWPSHYFSVPALSWDVMLNMKKFRLELCSDVDIYFLFKKDMRAGVCYISKRYSKANNKYLNFYNPKQEWTSGFKMDRF